MYKIYNDFLTVTISDLGAEIKSIIDNKSGYEFIWQSDEKYWARSAPILFPIIGKCENSHLFINHKEYKIPQHGFARDNKFKLVDSSNEKIEFELKNSSDISKLYPYKFNLKIKYQLIKKSLKQIITIFNEDEIEMFFSVGLHPGFNLPDDIKNYNIEISGNDSINKLPVKDNLRIGSIEKISDSNKISLNNNLFNEGVVIIPIKTKSDITLSSIKDNFKIKVVADNFDHVGLWTPINFDKMLCIEPWSGLTGKVNDSLEISEREKITKLKPNQNQTYSCEFKFDN